VKTYREWRIIGKDFELDQLTHVIEYKAYEDLQSQLREAAQALKEIRFLYNGSGSAVIAHNAITRLDDDYQTHGNGD